MSKGVIAVCSRVLVRGVKVIETTIIDCRIYQTLALLLSELETYIIPIWKDIV